MLKVGIRGLLGHKLRTALTALAVVLGVAFVAGTFVFTDTINESFKDLFERASQGVDVDVQPRNALGTNPDEQTLELSLPASTVEKVENTPGVAEAAGLVSSEIAMYGPDRKRIGTGGAPTFLNGTAPDRFDSLDYKEGRKPRTPDEVVIDKGSAERAKLGIGDSVTLAARAPAKSYKIVGIVTLGDVSNLGGAGFVVVQTPEAQRIAGLGTGYSEVVAAADGGVSPAQLKTRIAGALGRDVKVQTGEEQAKQQAKDIGEALGFIKIALLVFAGVALLVGGFLIFNTFAVTVAQRSREFALLRTLGASRRQVLNAVLAETALLGFVASVIGVAAGLLLAPALRALMASAGIDLPNTGTVVAPRTVIAGLIVGMVATMLSGLVPARRATRVDPVEAMRESATPGVGRIRRRRLVVAVLLAGLGVALLVAGLLGATGSASSDASLMGLGAVLIIFGIALFAPVLVRPLARAIGAPLRNGVPGRLARENAMRQPQRTAITASALMIGLALVVFVTIFAAGLRGSVDKVVDDQVRAALVITNDNGFGAIPAGISQRVGSVPGIEASSPLLFASGRVKGDADTTPATGLDPGTFTKTLALKWDQGSDAVIDRMTSDQAVVEEGFASERKLKPGSTFTVTTATGHKVTYTVAGTFDNKIGLTGDLLVTAGSMRRDWGVRDDAFVLAAGAPGADPAQLSRAVKSALRGFPIAKPMTREEFKDEQAKQVNLLLALVYGLLSLSVIVALLGIVNTLALAVFERTRELGMLRAVGMSRWQVRRMIGAESVITALIGAVLGLALGAALAILISRPLADEGFTLTFPVFTLIVLTILAAIAGIVAAIPPARRAARVDVLRAVTTE